MWCHPAVISCLKTPHGYYVVICVSYQKPLELAPNPWRAIDPHLLKSHPGPGEYFLSESAPRRNPYRESFFPCLVGEKYESQKKSMVPVTTNQPCQPTPQKNQAPSRRSWWSDGSPQPRPSHAQLRRSPIFCVMALASVGCASSRAGMIDGKKSRQNHGKTRGKP